MKGRFSTLVSTVLPVVVLLTGCGAKAPDAQRVTVPTVVGVQPVQTYSPAKAVQARYSAVIKPSLQLDLAFKSGGYVQSILKVRDTDGSRLVQEGDSVTKGTVLARVRSADYQAKVSEVGAGLEEIELSKPRASAALSAAEVARDAAKEVYQRTARLFETDSATKPEYDNAKSNYEVAEARVKEAAAQIEVNEASKRRAMAALSEAKLALQDSQLVSPINGVVLKRAVEEGSLVNQGTSGFTLANASTVKASFGVPDVELSKLKRGQVLGFTSEVTPGRTYQGTITDISPDADPGSRVFNIEVTLPNVDRSLKLGMVVAMAVKEADAPNSVLAIPLNAVIRSTAGKGGFAVFVVEEQNGKHIARERQLTVGESYGNMISVLEGVTAGDTVVTVGCSRLIDGQEVNPGADDTTGIGSLDRPGALR